MDERIKKKLTNRRAFQRYNIEMSRDSLGMAQLYSLN